MIMKKTFLTLFALISMGVSAMAGDKPVISVADVEALPGETVSFSVNLEDGKADTYTAMTLNAYFPTDGFSTTGDYTVANAWKGASCTVGDINPVTGLSTMPFASSNAIPGSAVEGLVTVEFTVANTVTVGEYDVTLQGTLFEYNTSDKDYADDVTFKVKVVSAHNVVLDELATDVPTAEDGVNVKVKRTIKANSWSTICLPFAMTAEQVTSAFGTGVMVKDFTGCETTESGNDITALKLNFSTVSAMEANHPYLIKVANAITYENGFTVQGVNIAPEAEPSVDRDEKSVKIGKNTYYYNNSFVGTYVADTTVPNLCLFINNDKFYYSNGSTKMKAFRGYFDLYDVLSSVDTSSARISMSFDDETTGINTVHGSNGNADGYYDLQGRKIENPKKGLYINNGKKVVVK